LDSLVVTHPFHPLVGRCLPVVLVRRTGRGLVFVCEVDGMRRVSLRQEWTDRGPEPAEQRVSADTLTALRALVDALSCRYAGGAGEGGSG
jgi:hypothetical protein